MFKRFSTNVVLVFALFSAWPAHSELFKAETFTQSDSILVVDGNSKPVFEWRADTAMIPASLVKLATAYLAIDKWGLEHQFITDFSMQGSELWVKGYGDPFLVSEELDVLVKALSVELRASNARAIKSIHIDNSHFSIQSVPGRSTVADPYNAPLSAVSANFNTAKLSKKNGKVISAELQTPLTPTAAKMGAGISKNTERVNLINEENAQRNFAELLAAKLGLNHVDIHVNQSQNSDLALVYRHSNSRRLNEVLRGTLEFSNNFMANQVFLQLSGSRPATFSDASERARKRLSQKFNWVSHTLIEGSGLSRKNRLSARQLNDLLTELSPHKHLLKKVVHPVAHIRAKTGTLDGVHSYAGYIDLPKHDYQFVFIFNRKVPWKYREQLLSSLVDQLSNY